jgi:aminoglycoside 3-N-acetyltransferase
LSSESPVLFHGSTGPLTQEDLKTALSAAGLVAGDLIFIHSDVRTFGRLGNILNRQQFLQTILAAFTEILGPLGTLIVPTYTYSYCKDEVFDVLKTPSTVGIFSEFVRTHPQTIRSDDPIFSHAGFGPQAEEILLNTGKECFGPDSAYDRFLKRDGRFINFGKFFDITFTHFIERVADVGYRMNKDFTGVTIDATGKPISNTYCFYVRKLPEHGMNVKYDIPRLGNELKNRGLLRAIPFGESEILYSRAQNCFDVGLEMLSKDPYAVLEFPPEIPTEVEL